MVQAPSMKMSVVGCGYLGAVHAAAMAELGHEVIGVEVDPERAAGLAAGSSPFYEPGLDEMLSRVLASGRLRITSDIADASEATIHFLCVGTPQTHGHNSADLTYVESAVESILSIVKPGDVVVGKSTVPVGTAVGIAERIHQVAPGATLIWNPEFLREGLAIEDTLRPDRVVMGIGALPEDERARDILVSAYAGILAGGTPLEITNYPTAELVKVAANAFLATKISFINAMADLCELAGADVTQLADAIGHDARIGRRFLNAGLGFGGGCLPKDIRAFMHRALELGAADTLTFLREVDIINVGRREKAVDEVREWLDGDLLGRRIAVLGAAFKPDSDDIRDSPALAVAEMLHLAGADVVVTDPRAIRHAQRLSPALTFAATPDEAAEGADIVLLLTEWREYVELDPVLLAKRVHTPRIFDCRNALNAAAWVDAGWEYRCLGRPLAGA
jgi:UDPglucose 6-dehydrogenase